MTVSTPVASVAPTGELRQALIGTRRQFLGAALSNVAALGIFLVGVAGWAFESMQIYSEPAPLGEQGYTLGPLFLLLAVLLLVASPHRVLPRRIDGSRARAMASAPMFRKRVRAELHGAELYKGHRYLPSVVVLALLWIGAAAAFYLMFREEWADPEVTVHAGTTVMVALLAAGFVGVLMMVPGRSRRTVLVDDEGRFFTDAGAVSPPVVSDPASSAAAPVAQVAQAAPVAPVASVAAVTPVAPVAARADGRGRLAIGAVVGVLVTVLVLVGVVAFVVLRAGEARSPDEVTDLFGQARVKCLDFDVITDSTSTKTLGCRTDDAQIITVTTYGNRPSPEEYLSESCAASEGSVARLRRGYSLVGEDFILDMHQLRHPDFVKVTPIERTSTRLARVLDASVVPYDCNAR